jgi:glycosyltransferase involved in cell wall biosynthesis
MANPAGTPTGAPLRARHILRALQQVLPVKLTLIETNDSTPAQIEAAQAEYPGAAILHLDDPTDDTPLRCLRRNLSLRVDRSHRLVCREISAFEAGLSPGDLVWAFGVKATAALRLDGRAHRTFLDVDDIPSQVLALERRYLHRWNERLALTAKIRQWRLRERRLTRTYAGVGVCSEADRRYLGPHPSIHVIPNGFDAPAGEPHRRPSTPPRLGFIGNLRYAPNVLGVSWFVREVWPRVRAAAPGLRLRVVGIGCEALGAPEPDIDLLGYLEDTASEMATWTASVVPVLIGGGTRIKIAEAFSRKCPVVSTPLGAYGLEVAHGRELLLAEAPGDFAAQCLRVLARPDEARLRAETAFTKFLREMTWDVTAHRVQAALEAALLRRAPVRMPSSAYPEARPILR